MELIGKVAIVTGGGTGIGKAIALSLAEQGATVIICGRRVGVLSKVVDQSNSFQGEIIEFQSDISKLEDVNRLVKTTTDKYKAIHILVNNAAIDGQGFIHEHKIKLWDQVMAINLRGPFLLANQILPIMRSQKEGHIINISSEAGLEYYKGYGAYGVAKYALNALSEFIQIENQEFGIRVNTICPGMVVTEMTEDLDNLVHENSLYPNDIAELVLWLITRRSNVKIGKPILIQTMKNPWR